MVSLRLKEIKDFNSLEFKKSLIIYQSSFPPNETRPIEKVIQMLKGDINYHLLIALIDSKSFSKLLEGSEFLFIYVTLLINPWVKVWRY